MASYGGIDRGPRPDGADEPRGGRRRRRLCGERRAQRRAGGARARSLGGCARGVRQAQGYVAAHGGGFRQLPQAHAQGASRTRGAAVAKTCSRPCCRCSTTSSAPSRAAQRAADVKAVTDGLSWSSASSWTSLGREGIPRVPDGRSSVRPGVHEAIQQVETADHAPGTRLAEVQPGYTQGERLVRAAMVVVAKAKSATEPSELASVRADGCGTDGENHRHRSRDDQLVRRRRETLGERQARRPHHPERRGRANDAVGRRLSRERRAPGGPGGQAAGGDQRREHRLRRQAADGAEVRAPRGERQAESAAVQDLRGAERRRLGQRRAAATCRRPR